MNPRVKGLFAVSLLFLLLGTGLAWHESGELPLAKKATTEPVEVDLAKLEAGEPVDNIHLKIGPHYACYSATIFSYKARLQRYVRSRITRSPDYALYPIISLSNAEVRQLDDLEKKYGKLSNVPNDVDFPPTRTRPCDRRAPSRRAAKAANALPLIPTGLHPLRHFR